MHETAINVFYIDPIMLVLCLMFLVTHYAQNYGSIVGVSPAKIQLSTHFYFKGKINE